MNTQRNIEYFKHLDALRFFAFLAVFFSHAPLLPENHFLHKYLKLGFLGIDFFFVLSSFLITWIILKEKDQTHRFSWKYFMIRRILRIWPLYFLIIITGWLAWVIKPDVSVPDLGCYVSFLANFYIIKYGDNFLFFLTFLWSISVEEQFYFFWSILLKFIKRYLAFVFVLLIIASLVFRWLNVDDSKVLYFHTLSILGNFGIGGLAAFLSFYNYKFLNFIKNMPKWLTAIPYLILFICTMFYYSIFTSDLGIIVERLIFSLIFGWIILEQNFAQKSFIKWGKFKMLNYLGKISYGLYMYHGLVLTIITIAGLSAFKGYFFNCLITLAAFLLTVAISAISYKYFEYPFLKLKKRFYTFDK
jgi:peptidoglycan/LPS O-acetylase OafA/YrhL